MNSEFAKYASEIVFLENKKFGDKYNLASLVPLHRLNPISEVDDSSAVFRIDGLRSVDDAIIIISNNRFPNSVSEAVEKTAAVAKKLEPQLCERVLRPSITGQYGLQSYAFWPRHIAISANRFLRRIQVMSVYKGASQWLGDVAKMTQLPVAPGEELAKQYTDPLDYLISQEYIPATIKEISSDVLDALRANIFRPVSVLQHGDFWYGNILLEKSWPFSLNLSKSFFIIDWASANVHGYPYVDQLRLLMSIGKRDHEILHHLHLYSKKCGLSINDVLNYVCAYIGHLGMNRNEFPLDRYLELIDSLVVKAAYVSKSVVIRSTL